MGEWIRFFAGGIFIVSGVVIAVIATIGLYRFRFVLNRMHAAAMCDTLALACVCIGLVIINGISFTSLKLLLIILFLWMASPVSSHLISRLEVVTDEQVKKECEEKL